MVARGKEDRRGLLLANVCFLVKCSAEVPSFNRTILRVVANVGFTVCGFHDPRKKLISSAHSPSCQVTTCSQLLLNLAGLEDFIVVEIFEKNLFRLSTLISVSKRALF